MNTTALFIFVLLTICPQIGNAQSIESIYQNAEKTTQAIYQKEKDLQSFEIKMAFEGFEVQNLAALQNIPATDIVWIDLIYTLFPKNKDFKELNINRLKSLQKIFPSIFERKNIQWRIIGQSDCLTRPQAEKLFHGLHIYHQPFQPIKRIFKFDNTPDKDLDAFGDFISGKPIKDLENKSTDLTFMTNLLEGKENPKTHLDSLVASKVLKENIEKWQNSLIVMDWTGSMYSFGKHILLWLKEKNNLTSKNIKAFATFNDGNGKKTGEKIIGETGGIYFTDSNEFESIFNVFQLAYSNDTQNNETEENDLEALLYAQSKCPTCEHIIYIADSRSMIRDIQLLPIFARKLKEKQQKLHIILCGAFETVVPDYFEIFLNIENVSLHTIEQDIDLETLKENDTIRIGNETFKYKAGRFVKVKNGK